MSAVPLLIAPAWLAGALVLAVILGRDPRSFVHLAQALILGPWLLAIEMLALNALGISLSLGVVLVPWWILGALAAKQMHGRSLKRGAPTSPLLVGIVGVAFLAILWVGLGSPITGGDPADNFAVFARTVAATATGAAAGGPSRSAQSPRSVIRPGGA